MGKIDALRGADLEGTGFGSSGGLVERRGPQEELLIGLHRKSVFSFLLCGARCPACGGSSMPIFTDSATRPYYWRRLFLQPSRGLTLDKDGQTGRRAMEN